jgi:subtilisin family serine protease
MLPPRSPHRTMLAALALFSCIGCSDGSATLAEPPGSIPALLGTIVECNVDVRSVSVVCREPRASQGAASLALLGASQIKMRSANVVSDTAQERFTMDAAAQNLLGYAIGTPDGETTTGLKVFFETGPTATAYYTPGDTGTVKVRNADGFQHFTGVQQPYYLYDTILPPQAITRAKRWEFHVPRTVMRFGFTVRVFTTTPRETRVGETPPDHTPPRYRAPSSSRMCNVSGLPECVFDAVMVRFRPGASREERQSAVDMVGTLEGGSADLGLYYVRIARDTTLARLRSALGSLRSLPQVEYAYPYGELPGSTFFLRPNDGANWNEWQLDDSLADGQNWSLEAISAAWGWGCETGARAAPVAIVDSDFHLVGDLAPNAAPQDSLVGMLNAAADAGDHGTFTAAVFGAVGNNQTGMTGLAWSAAMRLYEVAVADSAGVVRDSAGMPRLGTLRMAQQVGRAAREGASVVNLSMGIDWDRIAARLGWIPPGGHYDPATETNPQRIAGVDSAVVYLRDVIVGAVDAAAAAGRRPLIIIAAGNTAIDARWTGFAAARDARPGNFIIVGSGARIPGQGGLAPAPSTNHGRLVEIAAPGHQVWGLDRNGPKLWGGTSFAAPLVAATAALLISFDPRLEQHPDTLKALILEGARNGGRRMQNGVAGVDTIPVLNVYEALKAAARRSGAPLCGQRFWMQRGEFTVQRDSASDRRERLFSLGFNGVNSANALHGGKTIRFYNEQTSQQVAYHWSPNGGWALGASDSVPHPPGSNASMLSRDLTSHDRDTVLDWETQRVGSTVRYRFGLVDAATWSSVGAIAEISAPEYQTAPQCIQEFVEMAPGEHARLQADSTRSKYESWLRLMASSPCLTYTGPNAFVSSTERAALSPRLDAYYVFLAQESGGITVDDAWYPCGREGVFYGAAGNRDAFRAKIVARCRNWLGGSGTDGTSGYRVAIPSGAVTTLAWPGMDKALRYPSIRENVRELTLERSTEGSTNSGWWEQVSPYHWEHRSQFTSARECSLEFRNLATGAVEFAPPVQCQAGGGDAGIAPLRAPDPLAPTANLP